MALSLRQIPVRRTQRTRRRLKALSPTARRVCRCFRSDKNISAQIIDDAERRHDRFAASTLEGEKGKKVKGSDKAAAALIGKLIAERAIEKGVKDVVFDRGGYIFHGRVKALADAAREAGLNF
jgi:large subunit ribosomal protein L18